PVPWAGTGLSYVELNARANRLARVLVERGAAPERFVALAMPRGLDLVVAVLAVLKSGAAYLPLDPDYPAERLAHVLSDADPVLLLTSGVVSVETSVPRLAMDLALEEGAGGPDLTDADRCAPLPASAPAPALYTPGPPGQPKRAVLPHGDVAPL